MSAPVARKRPLAVSRRDVLATTVLGAVAACVTRPATAAVGFETLLDLKNRQGVPMAPLVFGRSKNELFVGTYSPGVILRLRRTSNGIWRSEKLYKFENAPNSVASITYWKNKIYGTTQKVYLDQYSRDTLFEFDPFTQEFKTIFSFGADRNYGFAPQSALLPWRGSLYGTTSAGGADGGGTVFRLISPDDSPGRWEMEVLYSFDGINGYNPSYNGLIVYDRKLYGATTQGSYVCGTAYSLDPLTSENRFTSLAEFHCGTDGGVPLSGLTLGQNGRLYGTTSDQINRDSPSYGHVFQIDNLGKKPVRQNILDFAALSFAYRGPRGRLVQDSAGRFYGVCNSDAPGAAPRNGSGCLFRFYHRSGTGWILEVLHAFEYPGGAKPESGVIIDERDGIIWLYGTTTRGGENQAGTVYCFTLAAD